MTAPILYCGDTSLDSAAGYLTGLMTFFGWKFDYVPSHEKVSRVQIERPRSLLIVSDYPAKQFDRELQELVVEQVDRGLGVLMIGGWESFHGQGGDWDGTPLAKVLPVEISTFDDRINFDQPALLHPTNWSELLWQLPWLDRPPTVGGINQIRAANGSEILLSVTSFQPVYDTQLGTVQWKASQSFPALITSELHTGRTAAFASDIAPHWVGGFVDWGPTRVTAQAPGAGAIEVGSDYALFWRRLLSWTGRLE